MFISQLDFWNTNDITSTEFIDTLPYCFYDWAISSSSYRSLFDEIIVSWVTNEEILLTISKWYEGISLEHSKFTAYSKISMSNKHFENSNNGYDVGTKNQIIYSYWFMTWSLNFKKAYYWMTKLLVIKTI